MQLEDSKPRVLPLFLNTISDRKLHKLHPTRTPNARNGGATKSTGKLAMASVLGHPYYPLDRFAVPFAGCRWSRPIISFKSKLEVGATFQIKIKCFGGRSFKIKSNDFMFLFYRSKIKWFWQCATLYKPTRGWPHISIALQVFYVLFSVLQWRVAMSGFRLSTYHQNEFCLPFLKNLSKVRVKTLRVDKFGAKT